MVRAQSHRHRAHLASEMRFRHLSGSGELRQKIIRNMKNKIIWLLLPLLLFGCSKKASIPFAVTIVETVEAKEINGITNQAANLLHAKDYDALDALAGKLRSAKGYYASGTWKLWWVHDGLDLPEEASGAEWDAHVADLRDWVNARPDSITAH